MSASHRIALARDAWRHSTALGTACLGVLALDGSLGPLGVSIDHALGIAAIATTLALGWPDRVRSIAATRRAWPAWLVGALGATILCAAQARFAWLFGATAAVAGLSYARRASGSATPTVLDALPGAFAVFAAVRLLVGASSAAFRVWNGASELLSRAVGGLLGVDLILGSSASGLALLLLHALVVWELERLRPRGARSRPWILLAPLAIQIGFLVRAALVLRDVDAPLHRGQDLSSTIVDPALALRACTEALLLVCLARFRSAASRAAPHSALAAPATTPRARAVGAVAAFGLLAIAASTLWERQALASARPGRLLLCGADAEHFAGLERRAAWLGFDTQRVDAIGAIDPPPRSGDVLAWLFPSAPASPEDAKAVLAAVAGGAGLLVSGDHTNVLHCAELLEPTLAPLGVALRFDSAFPIAPWPTACEGGFHAASPHWMRAPSTRYLVGASLDPPWRGRVLVSGRYAFGDRGDLESLPENFIGDRRLGAGDALGDRPLLVARSFGAGRAVVMGDSEALLDENLPYFQPCLEGVLAYLAAAPRGLATSELGLLVGGLALAAGALGALGLCALGLGPRGWAALAAALVALPFADPRLAPELFPDRPTTAAVHSIALAHQAHVSLDQRSPRSIDRLVVALEEHGEQAELVGSLDRRALARSSSLFLISPQSALDSAERAAVLDVARRGGVVVVATDWKRRHAVAGLLDTAGVDVLPILAARGVDVDLAARERPELFREPYALQPHAGVDVRALHCDQDGLMLAAETDLGRGRLVVVGDPLFFLGGNLGNENYAFGANLDLLHRIVEGP